GLDTIRPHDGLVERWAVVARLVGLAGSADRDALRRDALPLLADDRLDPRHLADRIRHPVRSKEDRRVELERDGEAAVLVRPEHQRALLLHPLERAKLARSHVQVRRVAAAD